jgi:two-component system, cell cycle sensor histidine kinase and response regulator CckA
VRVSSTQASPRETILVVDDELEVLALVADVLQAEEYTVLRASDPREALRLAQTLSEPIHLLLTDVVMPFITGVDLAAKLRSLRSGIKVLFMSAFTSGAIEDQGIHIAPGEPLLIKPFMVLSLSKKIRSLLDYHSPFSRPDRS